MKFFIKELKQYPFFVSSIIFSFLIVVLEICLHLLAGNISFDVSIYTILPFLFVILNYIFYRQSLKILSLKIVYGIINFLIIFSVQIIVLGYFALINFVLNFSRS